MLGACELGAEVRTADEAQARPLTVSIDLGLGGSLTLVERWALALIASGRTRIPIVPPPAGAAAAAWTASGGFTFGSPGEGFFRLEAGIASPSLPIIGGGGRSKEQLIKTPGGKKPARRPDILYETPTGQLRGRNVGRTKANGDPVPREVDALQDLNGPGGLPTDFVPYDR